MIQASVTRVEGNGILDKPDAEIDRIRAEEALRRARACDEGRMQTLSFEEIFGDK